MPCDGTAYRVRIGTFHPILISILKRKSEKARNRSGKYTPFSQWDRCTDFTFRCFVTTLCTVIYLLAVKCVLFACEKDWFVREVYCWMGGYAREDRQFYGAGGFMPFCRHSSTDAGVMEGLTHAAFCCQSLLRRCGDVELNPGPPKLDSSSSSYRQTRLGSCNRRTSSDRTMGVEPTTAQQVTGTTGENVTAAEPTLKDVMTMLVQMNSKFDVMKTDMKDMKDSFAQVKTEVEGMKKTMDKLKVENDCLREENKEMKTKLSQLELKTDDLECRSKRNNLLFYGFDRPDSETAKDIEETVQDFITDRLELSQSVEFDRIHRLNNKPNSPIIARCTYYKDKDAILKARGKLRGSTIFIGEDFSVRVRDIRKKLTPHLKAARNSGKRATMIFDHLLIDGKKFGIDNDGKLKEI